MSFWLPLFLIACSGAGLIAAQVSIIIGQF